MDLSMAFLPVKGFETLYKDVCNMAKKQILRGRGKREKGQ